MSIYMGDKGKYVVKPCDDKRVLVDGCAGDPNSYPFPIVNFKLYEVDEDGNPYQVSYFSPLLFRRAANRHSFRETGVQWVKRKVSKAGIIQGKIAVAFSKPLPWHFDSLTGLVYTII